MIAGIGNDVVDIRRIEAMLARYGARFETRAFTPGEIALANARPARRAATLALRFAAKEAVAKALGTGFRHGLRLQDIEVLPGQNGKPEVRLRGAPVPRLHVSLSDEYPYAWAVAVADEH